MNPRPTLLQFFIGTFVHRIPYAEMKRCLDLADGHGIEIGYTELAAHHLAGGRMTSLVQGLVYARANGLAISPANARARDLVAAHTTRISLTQHLQAFTAAGIRDLDSAPLDLSQVSRDKT